MSTRDAIVERLRIDLIGPSEECEKLTSTPTDTYLTGILWPKSSIVDASEDDQGGGTAGDNAAESIEVALAGQTRLCSFGMSFAVRAKDDARHVTLNFSCGKYSYDAKDRTWNREQILVSKRISIHAGIQRFEVVSNHGLVVECHLKVTLEQGIFLVTVTLINVSKDPKPADSDGASNKIDSVTCFQTEMVVLADEFENFSSRPSTFRFASEELESASLLYREVRDFATGHQCSPMWDETAVDVKSISSSWLPTHEVPAFSESGDVQFQNLVNSNSLSANIFATESRSKVIGTLDSFLDSYWDWISKTELEAQNLDEKFKVAAKRHIDDVKFAHKRMTEGVRILEKDELVFRAFQLANESMNLQFLWKSPSSGDLSWRPFQLGFILLNVQSISVPDSPDRSICDLLWFPTGGGKTEAYLAIMSMAAWLRRLRQPEDSGGNVAIMRYTLRLLTAQQFSRAAAVMIANDLIRLREFTCAPFSIGLWVGGDATPNSFEAAVGTQTSQSTPKQILDCFACGNKLTWNENSYKKTIRPKCLTTECILGPNYGEWPVSTIDEDIYNLRPTLLIGTVDKFAQFAFSEETKVLLGLDSKNRTELIIQDELHLISGPLGTIFGAYEVAFDWLIQNNGRIPKVIGSTATIRRAQQQVVALFGRESFQFPPSGITFENSGFAVVDKSRPGREYAAISTGSRSAKFSIQAVAASLLQSTVGVEASQSSLDPYATLLVYYNSLRELGGALVQMVDDVPDSIHSFAARRGEGERKTRQPAELTSRVSQAEIVEILDSLALDASTPGAQDIVLATNMISVGMDIPRLALMSLQGQPKTRAEYIQATSRVGRKADSPGLVVSVLTSTKPRDRSAFENFKSWHSALYRDVEATSVTPFSPRARDRALHAMLVIMIRHGFPSASSVPDLKSIPPEKIMEIIDFVEARAVAVDPVQGASLREQLEDLLEDWASQEDAGNLKFYKNDRQLASALLQTAEAHARKRAQGLLPGRAWPTLNSMRSVEPSTKFSMVESLARRTEGETRTPRPWRRT